MNFPGPNQAFGWNAPPVYSGPSPGQLAEMVLRLSPSDRAIFNQLVGAGADNTAGPSSGMTTRPSDGRVFKMTAPRERSEAFKRLEAAEKQASDSFREYVQSKGWTVKPAEVEQVGGITTVKVPTKMLDSNGRETTDAEATRRQAAVTAAKQAVKAYRQDNPDEFRPPAPVTRGGRGRGRGRGGRT